MQNILVTYSSHSGNTEKIATAIHAQASQKYDAVLMKLDAVDPEALKQYDTIFMGSPIHAWSLAKEVAGFLNQMPELPQVNFAGFITHAASAYPQQTLDQMTQAYSDACQTKKMAYKGCFSCQGYLAEDMHAAVQEMQGVDDAEWQRRKEQMAGHPNADDLAAARAFVRSILV